MAPRMSPWVLLQRQAGLYPGAGLTAETLTGIARGQGVRAARSARGLAYFGAGAAVQQTTTGLKAGVTAASTATAIGSGIAGAIGAGAAAGSVVPIIGTAIGAIVGLVASGVFSHRADPEVGNFNQAIALYNSNPQAVLNIANKYLVLAGLFDLEPGQIKGNIPIYKKYGRMGEERFVRDLVATIQSAANTGAITVRDTPMTVFNNVVLPWINSFGYGTMVDSNADMINAIILGMTAEYLAGLQTRWFAVGGQYPFGNIAPFKLPVAATQAAALPATPSVSTAYNPLQTSTSLVSAPISAPTPVSYTAANTTLTPADTSRTLNTPLGIFSFLSDPGRVSSTFVVTYNGAVTQGPTSASSTSQLYTLSNGSRIAAYAASALLWDGTHVYAKQPSGEVDVWAGNSWIVYQPAATPTVSAPPPAPASPPTLSAPSPGNPAVQIPPGFTAVSGYSGTTPVYVDGQGAYWTLTGTTLVPFTGTLYVNGQLVPIQNGLMTQQAVAQLPQTLNPSLYTNTQALPALSAPQAVAPVVNVTTPASVPAPVTSGLSGNLSLWIAGGLAVLGVLFATARPAPPTPARRST